MRADFYVYVLTQPWDGAVCYVGKGRGKRYRDHAVAGASHSNRHLARIFKEAERIGAQIEATIVRPGLDEAEAYRTEEALIAALGRKDRGEGPLANRTDGGGKDSGTVWSIESREKLSVSAQRIGANPEERARRSLRLKVLWERPEHQQKCSAAMKAAHRRPEVKARKSASRKALWLDPDYRANMSAAVSRCLKIKWGDPDFRARQLANLAANRAAVTDEFIATCAAATKASWEDPATRANRVAGLKGQWATLSPEARLRRLAGMKASNEARKLGAAAKKREGGADVGAR